jgi:ketosteroid isomerase-like protein
MLSVYPTTEVRGGRWGPFTLSERVLTQYDVPAVSDVRAPPSEESRMRTLKSLMLAVGTMLALSACAPAAPPAVDTADDEAALKAATRTWLEAYNAGDVEKIVALYAEDAVLMPPHAPVANGHAAIRAFLTADTAGAKAAGVKLVPGTSTAGVAGDTGWGIGDLHRHYCIGHHRRQRQLFVGVAQVEWQVALLPRYLQLGPPATGGSSSCGKEVTRAKLDVARTRKAHARAAVYRDTAMSYRLRYPRR